MAKKTLDRKPLIVLEKPDVNKMKTAHRWLRGVVALLAEAANRDPVIEGLVKEATTLQVVTGMVIAEYSEQS